MKEQSNVASCGGKGIPSSPLGMKGGGKVERWVHSCLQRAVLGAGETAVITTNPYSCAAHLLEQGGQMVSV